MTRGVAANLETGRHGDKRCEGVDAPETISGVGWESCRRQAHAPTCGTGSIIGALRTDERNAYRADLTGFD